jgi:hypothetical protein
MEVNALPFLTPDSEYWMAVNGFPMYQVSSFGRVRNVKSGKMLKPILMKTMSNKYTNYQKVSLYNSQMGKIKQIYVHQLVANTFIVNDDPQNKKQVDHIDSDKANNHYTNLRWCTASQNLYNSRKVKHGSSKYKGVYFCTIKRKYLAAISTQINGKSKRISLGTYDREEDAAEAYNRKLIEIAGAFAKVNVIV